MMKASPSHTVKALALHNAVLRKAAHIHAGHVFEQEGDSWAVAFQDAFDAAAFCLQVQQALRKVGGRLRVWCMRGHK
jgi:class 3 adenylate cyclase